MKSRNKKLPGKRDLRFLNENRTVACNPRDREAAHRTEVESIANENPLFVTCKKMLGSHKKNRNLKIKMMVIVSQLNHGQLITIGSP